MPCLLFLIVSHRSMAQKESYHREVVDELNAELSQVQRQLDDLTALSRDQVNLFFICYGPNIDI